MLDQSPWPRHPAAPSPHVSTIPLSLENTLKPSPQQALQPLQPHVKLHTWHRKTASSTTVATITMHRQNSKLCNCQMNDKGTFNGYIWTPLTVTTIMKTRLHTRIKKQHPLPLQPQLRFDTHNYHENSKFWKTETSHTYISQNAQPWLNAEWNGLSSHIMWLVCKALQLFNFQHTNCDWRTQHRQSIETVVGWAEGRAPCHL